MTTVQNNMLYRKLCLTYILKVNSMALNTKYEQKSNSDYKIGLKGHVWGTWIFMKAPVEYIQWRHTTDAISIDVIIEQCILHSKKPNIALKLIFRWILNS